MLGKFYGINLFLAIVFILTTVFPASLFSYETTNSNPKENWTDESLNYKLAMYTKVRCPRCGMEFYYIPGKESPHSHWVHYEVSEDELRDRFEAKKGKDNEYKEKEIKKHLSGLLGKDKYSKELLKKGMKGSLLKDDLKKEASSLEGFQLSGKTRYELRQKLTCPYDGYEFLPGGVVMEDMKLMQKTAILEESSIIEKSFSKSIAFGISKDLKQFGYDLFIIPEEEKEEESEAKDMKKSTEDLTALGMLKAAFKTSSSPTFSEKSSEKQTPVIPVGPDYVIGPGDTLVINIWGSIQESFPAEVDREGKIMLPKAGPLYLRGVKFQEAEKKIKARLNQFYTNFNVDVSMGELRDIQIYVMGEVKKPGSYVLDSQSNVFQALYAADGPTKLGSLRKIKLISMDGKEKRIDLYPFLLEGKNSELSKIQSGDTIFVPTIGDTIAIAGNVKRPAIYETKSTVPLSNLLNFAGGVTPTGDLQRVQIERVKDNERRVMVDIELKPSDVGKFSSKDINIQNGDIVFISPIVRLKHNFVSVLGNVERPGDYALAEDMSVSDLIKRAKGFLPATYLHRAEITRVTKNRTRRIIPVDLDKMMMGDKEENALLQEWDILLIYSEAEVNPPSFIEIEGAVNRPGKYELTPGMKVSDLVFRAGGIKSDKLIKGAELFHIMPGEAPAVRNIAIKQLSGINMSIDKDIMLRAGDALFIKSEPKLTERKVVAVKGEVRYPGTYSIREGERFSSVIERAGGFTREAFPEGAMFTRLSIKNAQERMRQRFLQKEQKTLLEEQQSIMLRTGTSLNTGLMSESLKIRSEMLNFIASADIEGRMVVKLSSDLKGSKYDILLEGGDSITIPQIPAAIMVIGSVNNPASVPYEKGKGIEYYIRKTGGMTKHADKKGIYVMRTNGEAISKFMMSKTVKRGDTIVVPQEFKYWTPPGQLLRDTVEILSRMAIGVGIIAALD